jgi:hypothetical protein
MSYAKLLYPTMGRLSFPAFTFDLAINKKCRTSSGISLLSPNLDLRKTCPQRNQAPTLKE